MGLIKELAKDIVYGIGDFLTFGKGINRNIGGFDIRFPVRFSRYYPTDYEPYLFQFLKKNCHEGYTFLDCGAHIGLFSVVGSRIVGERGKVVSFEPMPSIRAVLENTISINNCSNVTVRPEAVSSKIGEARFFDTGNVASNANSLVQQDRHAGNITVPVTTIDQVRAEMNLRINCIKIDVEGAEYDLLRGASKTLRSDRPVLFLSLHPTALNNANVSLSEIWAFLNSNRYSLEFDGERVTEAWFCEQTYLFDVECIPVPDENSPDDPSA